MTKHEGMAALEEAVQRTREKPNLYSSQTHYKDEVFGSFFNWFASELDDSPYPYRPNSRARDAWLREIWKKEPHLAGVMNGAVAIDKNRTWTLTGPIRQVTQYSNVLDAAEDGRGWRHFISKAATNYYASDMGTLVEVGRDGPVGPARAFYNVDPAQAMLTGDRDLPLAYYPTQDEVQLWTPYDFFRVASMPSTDVRYRDLGFCAVSRAIELVKLLMAVYQYDQEMLGARAPKGLLLLQNVTEEQWDQAMAARDARLDSFEQKHYGGVAVLAQFGPDEVDAKLVALSQLPAEFDREAVTNQIMYGLALCFGYPPDEFWPVQFGALGRGTETQIHHMRGAGKGGSDFLLGFSERMQDELPPSLVFSFEHRDSQESIQEALVYDAWAAVADKLYQGGTGPLTLEEVRRMLVHHNVIMGDELTTDDNSGSSQADKLRSRYLSSEAMFRAARQFPDEPIVTYEWPTKRYRVLWSRGSSAVPMSFHVPKLPPKTRAQLALAGKVELTDDMVDGARESAKDRYGEDTAQLTEEFISAQSV